MEWLTIEVFDEAHAAWLWRDRHGDLLVSSAVAAGVAYWQWHEFGFGVALELAFADEAAAAAFRRLPAVRAALDLAPDPVHGVLVYRGRGGGAAVRVPRRPRPHLGAGALDLPGPEPQTPESDTAGRPGSRRSWSDRTPPPAPLSAAGSRRPAGCGPRW